MKRFSFLSKFVFIFLLTSIYASKVMAIAVEAEGTLKILDGKVLSTSSNEVVPAELEIKTEIKKGIIHTTLVNLEVRMTCDEDDSQPDIEFNKFNVEIEGNSKYYNFTYDDDYRGQFKPYRTTLSFLSKEYRFFIFRKPEGLTREVHVFLEAPTDISKQCHLELDYKIGCNSPIVSEIRSLKNNSKTIKFIGCE